MKTAILTIILSFTLYQGSFGQDLGETIIFKTADQFFDQEQYIKALRFYKQILDDSPGHNGAKYKMAECYRLTFDYESALFYYKEVVESGDLRFPLAHYQYANMLKLGGEYNLAIQEFEAFHDMLVAQGLERTSEFNRYYHQSKIEKEGCMLALTELTNTKPDHNFKVCDNTINTPYNDYAAFTYDNDTKLCLTSAREKGKGNLVDHKFGESFADLFRLEYKDDKWVTYDGDDRFQKTMNTKYGDGSGSFNQSQTKFYYTNCNPDLDEVCHIYVSNLIEGIWSYPESLNSSVNMAGYDSRHPNVSPGGDTLFFSSNRPGGHGEYDIWMSINVGNDNWSEPLNLGDQVNTAFFEFAPFYDLKEKVMFFSSNGHRGFGGFDIYLAKGKNFLEPEIFNPGAPYNSNGDELFISLGKTRGYLSSNRSGGPGKLDIYQFDIVSEEAIITEISTEEHIAGRNSLFSDDYEFDTEEIDQLNEVISKFLAEKVAGVELMLTDVEMSFYQSLSTDDKERVDRILYARLRNLSENELVALRIEDEYYYNDLKSDAKKNLDNIVFSFLSEDQLALSVGLDPISQSYYSSLSLAEREKTDQIIAMRVQQANNYEIPQTAYPTLDKQAKVQVDNITYKYFQNKSSIDALPTSPTEAYYLKNLSVEDQIVVYQAIKEKLIDLTNDPAYALNEDDRVFYENLTTGNQDDLHSIANAFLLSDVGNLDKNLSQENLKMYRLFNENQKKQLNRILAKVIENTVKADLYFAETSLNKDIIEQMVANNENEVPENVFLLGSDRGTGSDLNKVRRFINTSAPVWVETEENTYIQPLPEKIAPVLASTQPAVNLSLQPSLIETKDSQQANTTKKEGTSNGTNEEVKTTTPINNPIAVATQPAVIKEDPVVESKSQEEKPQEAIVIRDSELEKPAITKQIQADPEPIVAITTKLNPVLEKEQLAITLSEEDIAYYEGLSPEKQKAVDRIIGMEYINNAYNDNTLEKGDEDFYGNLSKAERTYLTILASDLKGESLNVNANNSLYEAYAFYNNLAPSLKSKWNRIVLKNTLDRSSTGSFRISPQDAKVRTSMTSVEKEKFSNIKDFRFANERVISENLPVESNDVPAEKINFGIARYSNPNYNYVEIKGRLINVKDGTALSDFPVNVVTDDGEVIAKARTGNNGFFVFNDVPKGNYRVVSENKAKIMQDTYFIKDLAIIGTETSPFKYQIKANIYFDFDSYLLRPEAKLTLDEIADYFKKDQDVFIELRSHTDNIGGEQYNLQLSQKRNEEALKLLKAKGIKATNIEWLAMGKRDAVATNENTFGRQFNRRIEIDIKSNKPIDYIPAEVYLVRPKGTLYSISKNFGLTVDELKVYNGLGNGQLQAYKPIRILNPKGLSPNLDMLVPLNESLVFNNKTYRVKKGETIEDIAAKLNLPEELLIELNNLSSPFELKEGDILKIFTRN